VLADFPTDTWVTYTMDPQTHAGQAVVSRGDTILKTVALERCIPHNYVLWVDIDGNDAWVGTSKGLGLAIGDDYYPRLKATIDQRGTP